MSMKDRLNHELKAIVPVTLFFAAWLGVFMGLKVLILEDYQIRTGGFSMVLIGAMVLAKVVLVDGVVTYWSSHLDGAVPLSLSPTWACPWSPSWWLLPCSGGKTDVHSQTTTS